MATSDNDAVIIRSTIDLGHNLGLRVVAEGVETAAIAARLRRLGCDVAQGTLLSQPVTGSELTVWAAESRRGGVNGITPLVAVA